MLDKDRITIAIETIEGGGTLCKEFAAALREKLLVDFATNGERDCGTEPRLPTLHEIGRSIGKYLYRKALWDGTGKDQFVKHCIPIVLQKRCAELSPEPDFERDARKLCTEMWEENAG